MQTTLVLRCDRDWTRPPPQHGQIADAQQIQDFAYLEQIQYAQRFSDARNVIDLSIQPNDLERNFDRQDQPYETDGNWDAILGFRTSLSWRQRTDRGLRKPQDFMTSGSAESISSSSVSALALHLRPAVLSNGGVVINAAWMPMARILV